MNRREASEKARAAKAAKQPTLEVRFWSKVDRRGPDECWPWTGAARKATEGYGAFWLDRRHQPASRVALMLSGVEISGRGQALHSCDNPKCCNPAHLFVGTNQENNADKIAKGRHAYGSRVGTAKLTEQQVQQIRELRPSHTLHELSDRFGVNYTVISKICLGKSWTHVESEATA